MKQRELGNRRILLGITGSIAAYKSVEILRMLQEQGADVQVLMTKNAGLFVARLTLQTLSGHPVPGPQDWEQPGIGHIDASSRLDAVLVAPATANIIGKLAAGIADDMLTTTLLAADCPLIIAPAMNDRMYRNPIVQRNISALKSQGVRFVEPGFGQLACKTFGQGRLADMDAILQTVTDCLQPGELAGSKVLVTAGPTREPIDAVRFITNPSTGKMGFALAAAAFARGAEVVLISGPTEIAPPQGPKLIRVTTADEMHEAVMAEVHASDVVIMAAAVSDFKPETSFKRKQKKHEAPTTVALVRTRDILKDLRQVPGKRILVGFAAETDDLEKNALAKLKDKELDLIVGNDLLAAGAGFGSDTNSVTVIDRMENISTIPLLSKTEIASRVIGKIIELRTM